MGHLYFLYLLFDSIRYFLIFSLLVVLTMCAFISIKALVKMLTNKGYEHYLEERAQIDKWWWNRFVICTVIMSVLFLMISVIPKGKQIVTYYVISTVDEYHKDNPKSILNPKNSLSLIDLTIQKVEKVFDLSNRTLEKVEKKIDGK